MFAIDLNFVRVAVTLLSFVTFLGIVAWALAKRNRNAFDEAALLPFADGSGTSAITASHSESISGAAQ